MRERERDGGYGRGGRGVKGKRPGPYCVQLNQPIERRGDGGFPVRRSGHTLSLSPLPIVRERHNARRSRSKGEWILRSALSKALPGRPRNKARGWVCLRGVKKKKIIFKRERKKKGGGGGGERKKRERKQTKNGDITPNPPHPTGFVIQRVKSAAPHRSLSYTHQQPVSGMLLLSLQAVCEISGPWSLLAMVRGVGGQPGAAVPQGQRGGEQGQPVGDISH